MLTADRPRALKEAVGDTQGPTQLPSLPWLPSSEGGGRWAASWQGSRWAGPFVAWVRARGNCHSWATSDRWDHREGGEVPSEGVSVSRWGLRSGEQRKLPVQVLPGVPPPSSPQLWAWKEALTGLGGCRGPCRAQERKGSKPLGRRVAGRPGASSLAPLPPASALPQGLPGEWGGQRTRRPGSRAGRSPCPRPLAQARAQGLRNAAKGGVPGLYDTIEAQELGD